MQFRYPAVLSVQIEGGKRLISFSAPAADIGTWGGVPQKKRFDDGEETAGFQREDNPKRIKGLTTFLKDPRNTLQNPLLCSERGAEGCTVAFEPIEGQADLGHVVIEMPEFSSLPLLEVFDRVQRYLEGRVPTLKERPIPETVVVRLQHLAREAGHTAQNAETPTDDSDGAEDGDGGTEDQTTSEAASTAVLFEDSHISDFWDEVAARKVVLEKIDPAFAGDEFLGFTREALESYIRPIVIMDGQHRLLGALEAARQMTETSAMMEVIENRIDAGELAAAVSRDLLRQASRRLSVSLLMDPHPAEHVFQFVVVNQKATPIGRALLGTIVSTSLSNEELETVAARLQAADIPLEESRAASFMARSDMSPFAGKVELGLSTGKGGNKNELLAWPVMVGLVQMFRDLQGAYLYHQKNNDFAKAWSDRYLDASPIVANYRAAGFETPREYWNSFDGPWRGVFIEFWRYVADFFGEKDEPTAWNYWGHPRTSNLFNKISLNILAADFFRYMRQSGVVLADSSQIQDECAKWLSEIDRRYFARDWKLDRAGVKKDSPGIRAAWAKTWDEYRQNPERLPRIENYKPSVV